MEKTSNNKSEKPELIVSIIYTDNIVYGLYSNGEILFYNELGNLTQLKDKKKIQEIRECFQSP